MKPFQVIKQWWSNTMLDDTAHELELLFKHLPWLDNQFAKAHELRADAIEAHYQCLEMQAEAADPDILRACQRRQQIFEDRLDGWLRRVSPYGHLDREITIARIAKLQSKQRRLTSA